MGLKSLQFYQVDVIQCTYGHITNGVAVMIVGSLIYLLGLDLLKESVYDTWGRVSRFEYFTIWVIIVVMVSLLLV